MSAGLKGYCYSHSSAVSPRCSVEHCSAQWRSTVAVSKITSSNYAVHAFLLCWPFLPHRPHMVLLTTHSHVVCSVCWAHTSKMCKNGWTDQDTIWRANFQNSQSMSRHIDKKTFLDWVCYGNLLFMWKANSCGSTEPCVSWRYRYPDQNLQFWGGCAGSLQCIGTMQLQWFLFQQNISVSVHDSYFSVSV